MVARTAASSGSESPPPAQAAAVEAKDSCGERQAELCVEIRMQFPPQPKKEIRIQTRELQPAMDFEMTPAAERNMQSRLIGCPAGGDARPDGIRPAPALVETQWTAAVSL